MSTVGGVPQDGRPLLVVLDGDGLLHRAHHGLAGAGELTGADRDHAGRPTWALRGLVGALAAVAARLRPDAVLVALDSRVDPVRRAMDPAYKAHRPPREPDLEIQLASAAALLADGGVPHACVDGFEGDDVLASAGALARREGWRCVLVTSDRDAFALVDEATSVLRVGDGGVEAGALVTPGWILATYGVSPRQYGDLAALRGDPSDNLPGVRGIGTKTAARLLTTFGSAEAVFAALDDGGPAAVEAAAGAVCAARLAEPQARDVVARNTRLMTMRTDLALPDPGMLLLPLDADRLGAALRARQIRLGASLWALVGGSPPPWQPGGFDKAPARLPAAAPPPWALPSVPTFAELVDLREERSREQVAARAPRPRRRPGRAAPAVADGQLLLF